LPNRPVVLDLRQQSPSSPRHGFVRYPPESPHDPPKGGTAPHVAPIVVP
jgi:hypothetical protein